MKRSLTCGVLIIISFAFHCSCSTSSIESCTNEPSSSGKETSMLQVSRHEANPNMLQKGLPSKGQPEQAEFPKHMVIEGLDHVPGVSKDSNPWANIVSVGAEVPGYLRLDGDCPWNNIAVYEYTSLASCAAYCHDDCDCLGFSWAQDRCIPKSGACTNDQVWHNIWTFYVKPAEAYCTTTTTTTTTTIPNYVKCAAWGDPHYTNSFFGNDTLFDYMGMGNFLLAETKDKSFQLQGFQGPLGWGAGFAGFAMKVGATTVSIIGREIMVDGVPFTGYSVPSIGLTVSGATVKVEVPGGCVKFQSINKTSILMDPPGYYHNLNLAVCDYMASSVGICGDPNGRLPIPSTDAFFTPTDLARLCSTVPDAPNCFKSWSEKTPTEMCTEHNIDFNQAVAACSRLQAKDAFYQGCLYDYCASGGDPNIVQNAIEAAYMHDTFPSEIIPPLIGCFKDWWDRDMPVLGAPGGATPAVCKAACAGYAYFGVQSNHECWCGNDYGKHGPADGCKCDDPYWTGAPFTNCIYGTPK